MKNKILAVSSALVLALLLFAVAMSVRAQATGMYRAEVPFDFTVGNTVHQAGSYLIKLEDPTDQATILSMINENSRQTRSKAVIRNGSVSENAKTVLIFARYGDRYILKRIAAPDFGFDAPVSKIEKKLARNQKKPADLVAVVMNMQKADQ